MGSPKKRSRTASSSSAAAVVNAVAEEIAERKAYQLHDSSCNEVHMEGKRRLFYPQSFGARDLRLMEVPADLLSTIMSGQNLKIVGDTSKTDAVLCSDDRTYSIRKVETSNQIYLVPPSSSSDFPLECGINEYYEIKPIAGHISRIKELLETHQYEGEENEGSKDVNLFLSREQLWQQVQASDQEMESALLRLGVVHLRGYMRMLSPTAAAAISRDLLDTAIVGGWDMNNVSENVCMDAMPGIDSVLLRYVLSTLGKLKDSSDGSDSTSTSIWELESDKVARKTAHMLFSNREGLTGSNVDDLWPVSDFLLEWGARTPGLAKNSESLLAGIAIVIHNETAKSADKKAAYRYAPAEKVMLLNTPQERLKKLFSIKSKFELPELEPYLKDLVGGAGMSKSITELLLLHARLVDGKYYMSR